jgi:uncharacterized protein (DUF362 family)
MLDSQGREWLHDGRNFFPKLLELNLAYSADLIIADASKVLVDKELTKNVEPGIIIASGNRVSCDAISVALMRLYGAERVSQKSIREHEQFKIATELDLGSSKPENIIIRSSNLTEDPTFPDLIDGLKQELKAS